MTIRVGARLQNACQAWTIREHAVSDRAVFQQLWSALGGKGAFRRFRDQMRAVELTLRQGERSWPLGTADAADRDREYAISWPVRIPTEVRPGPATLTAP